MDKFQNKYRIPSARAPWWDYGSNAAYFITICTKHRKHYFGEIRAEKMQLYGIGEITEMEWLKTPSIRPDMNLELDVFVVMPNHFHAIIWIGDNKYNRDVEAQCIAHLRAANKFGPQLKNLASIVRGFKSAIPPMPKRTI